MRKTNKDAYGECCEMVTEMMHVRIICETMETERIVTMTKQSRPSLGTFLRERRQELGLSTHEVSRRSGINQASVVRIEQGNSAQPGPDTLRALAAALELDLSDVWAMAGYRHTADLPGPLPYLRAKYRDLSPEALQALSVDVAQVLTRHGIPTGAGPAPGEDELPDSPVTAKPRQQHPSTKQTKKGGTS